MIIGLSGYARSGKDTVAARLVAEHGFVRLAFADPMREALYRLNPKIDLADMQGVYLSQAVDQLGWEGVKESSTDVRELLQRFGTEVVRTMFGDNFWVDYTMHLAEAHEFVVVSDVRFKNEADAIRAAGGAVWRIDRPGTGAANGHSSENDLDGYEFDFTVNNVGTIEVLHNVVDFIIEGALDE